MIGAALVELCETAGLSFADATRRAGRTWGIFFPRCLNGLNKDSPGLCRKSRGFRICRSWFWRPDSWGCDIECWSEMSWVLKVSIHATPGARRTEAAGMHGNALKVRLAAPPVDGKANEALLTWAADVFGVPRRQVDLLHGAAGRQKVLAVQCADEHALQQARLRLQQLCHGAPGSST